MIKETVEINHDVNYHYLILDKIIDKYYFSSNYIPVDKYLAICYETKRYCMIDPDKITKILHTSKNEDGGITFTDMTDIILGI